MPKVMPPTPLAHRTSADIPGCIEPVERPGDAAARAGRFHEIKSADILQPGLVAIEAGPAQLPVIIRGVRGGNRLIFQARPSTKGAS